MIHIAQSKSNAPFLALTHSNSSNYSCWITTSMLEIGVLSGTLQGCHPTLTKNVGQCKSIHGLCAMPKLGLTIAPTYKGTRNEHCSTNNVEYEFWFGLDSEDMYQSLKGGGLRTWRHRILIAVEGGTISMLEFFHCLIFNYYFSNK